MTAAPVILVGDSDIARWPPDLWPEGTIECRGRNGWTLREVVEGLIREDDEDAILVVCAGENDIGSLPLSDTQQAFRDLCTMNLFHVLFLGPKFEPWLADDTDSRKAYVLLSQMMGREATPPVQFIDCLLMFCGDSAHQPGALLGGRGRAESRFFDPDQLHLSREGYEIWKTCIEEHVQRLGE